MTAEEATAAGLVTNVVSPNSLISHCLEIASKFTAENKQTMAFAKQAICRGECILIANFYCCKGS